MPMNRGMYTSASQEWETPWDFFRMVNGVFHCEIDVCATRENRKCREYYSIEDNALRQRWAPRTCWMNPPFGYQITKWIRKAYTASLAGATVVCLIPARTDTAWWHEYCMHGAIYFIRGRIAFLQDGTSGNPAPFPCALVVFSQRNNDRGIVRSLERR